ncbi:DUF1566 domain-containing protein [Massilia putida]|uniref:Lcl C-terminal domain-containing protein n=1 Tax=Massilia putida TaxID=1141883 RepID=UPI000952E2B5|nr:DUF1566 domain-containing protein [Massilia putida]
MNHQNEIPAALGAPLEGGFYAGRIMIAGGPYALIVAPKDEGERNDAAWLDSEDRAEGADSYCDGMQNTKAMAAAGSELAEWALGLNIGGHADWYIPSQDELEIIYRNLKPTARTNSLYGRSGVNASAVPPTHAYTAGLPAQTAAPDFVEGGAQAFVNEWYWSSTQHASDDAYAWYQYFNYGNQSYNYKSAELRARAVRRFAI